MVTPGPDLARRFGGIARLYGEQALARFAAAQVCVIGVGGVGSWAVEALARSGIGALTLVDLDHVSESNINRQLPAKGRGCGSLPRSRAWAATCSWSRQEVRGARACIWAAGAVRA